MSSNADEFNPSAAPGGGNKHIGFVFFKQQAGRMGFDQPAFVDLMYIYPGEPPTTGNAGGGVKSTGFPGFMGMGSIPLSLKLRIISLRVPLMTRPIPGRRTS